MREQHSADNVFARRLHPTTARCVANGDGREQLERIAERKRVRRALPGSVEALCPEAG